MLDQTKILAFEHLYHISGIPFHIAQTKGDVVLAFPPKIKDAYHSEYWTSFPGDLSESDHPEGVTLICVGETYHVAIIKLDRDHYFSTVPLSSAANRNQSFFPALHKGIRPEMKMEFFRFLSELPSFSTTQLAETASLAKLLYCGEPAYGTSLMYLSEGGVPLKEVRLEEKAAAESLVYTDRAPMKHITSDFEEAVKSAIAAGDEAMLDTAIRRPTYGAIGRMSLNDLRQAKYEFICMMYACCRAAIQGGLVPEFAYQLSDLYCQRMDGMTRIDEINLYSRECMRQFCRRVAQNKHSASHSPYTVACCEYIRQHLLEPMDVDTISTAVGLNRRSLARYFIEDMGMTISEYMADKRLEEGAYLLTNSDLSLSDISNLLQFSSQSQFTQKFKARYGETPMKYKLSKSK